MRILIVEDEPLAAAQLAAHIAALKPDAKIMAVCDTVKMAIRWLENNEAPDLAFFDIHLGDGLSFEIFENSDFSGPVIFITAFDQYAIQAFKVNSIDYLLKPVERDELKKALIKFENQNRPSTSVVSQQTINEIISTIKQKNFKERFLVKVGTRLKVIKTEDILYFYSFQKGTFTKLTDGKDYMLDTSLEQVESAVNPAHFFRINRKYLVALPAINDVVAYSNSRFKLKIRNNNEDDFLVAREKVKEFKRWLEGEK